MLAKDPGAARGVREARSPRTPRSRRARRRGSSSSTGATRLGRAPQPLPGLSHGERRAVTSIAFARKGRFGCVVSCQWSRSSSWRRSRRSHPSARQGRRRSPSGSRLAWRAQPLDGRLLLLISTDEDRRAALPDRATAPRRQQVFGIDVDGWTPGRRRDLRRRRPRLSAAQSLRDVPAGRRTRVQALLHQLRDVPPRRRPHREAAHGPRRGAAVEPRAGQPLQHAAQGHASTRERRGRRDRRSTRRSRPSRSRRTRSTSGTSGSRASGSRSSGAAPMYLGAHVLRARRASTSTRRRAIPLVINHGHFPQTIDGFREEPPDPNLKPDYSDRFHLDGYNRIAAGVGLPALQGLDGARASRACSSSRSSTRTRTTTTPTP